MDRRTSSCASCSDFATVRRGNAILLGEVDEGPASRSRLLRRRQRAAGASTSRSTATSSSAGPGVTPTRSRFGLSPAAHHPRGRPVGQFPAPPRRAQPLAADQGPARSRSSPPSAPSPHADLRPRPAPPPGADAGRDEPARSASPTACSSACPARRCSSTARRSAWARTSRCRAAQRADADAMDARRHGGFSTVEDADALCRPPVDAEGWGDGRGRPVLSSTITPR